MNLKIISAGAGSGKTHRLTHEMVSLLASGEVRAHGIVATTFTKKAAAELHERVRLHLIEKGLTVEANELPNALIGTVHSLGVRLLKRFAYEAGVSPDVDIIADEDHQVLFNQSLAMVLTQERVEEVEKLADRLGLNKSDRFSTDWRKVLKELTEVARANDFSSEVLDKSIALSIATFKNYLLPESEAGKMGEELALLTPARKQFNDALGLRIRETIESLANSDDPTKKTSDAVAGLQELHTELERRGELFWYQWAKISKTQVAVKSKGIIEPLVEFANSHIYHPCFFDDVSSFIQLIFELSKDAISEYDSYKKRRGLIDYTDMEVSVRDLLENETVQSVLAEELDLLMVDEFQDTNPIQLDIFLKLSRFAKYSIWVGDPKQSIYGFRGAEPELMEAIIQSQGGLKKENILEHSWRSREEIVYLCNAMFTKAFVRLSPEQVALTPKRSQPKKVEGSNHIMAGALHHWHFKYTEEGGRSNTEWFDKCIAQTLKQTLDEGLTIQPKNEKMLRPAKPGDVAIFCRSNSECLRMASAMQSVGLKSAISSAGLLNTAEAKLVLACLKFILNKNDSLAIAEILLLGSRLEIEEIIESRIDFLEALELENKAKRWASDNALMQSLNTLRQQVVELSGSEIFAMLIEELDIQRIIAAWGFAEQRQSNLDELYRLSLKYENACMHLHSAASLGGYLLWLNELETNEKDMQGSGEDEDSVNILTYHRGKGLEYPVVVCHSLENRLRAELWGLAIVPEKDEVDLGNLLGNRWLRFWVNPYSDQFKNTLLTERMDASPEKEKKIAEALSEEARLMYVGLTRARDYLILPTRESTPIWLNRVCNAGNEKAPTLNNDGFDTYLEWGENQIAIKTQVFTFSNEFTSHGSEEKQLLFLEERLGQQFHLPYKISHSDEQHNKRIQVSILNEHQYFNASHSADSSTSAQSFFHDFIIADELGLAGPDRLAMAEEYCSRHHPADIAVAEELLKQSSAFHSWMRGNFNSNNIFRRYPLKTLIADRSFETNADFLIESEKEITLIFSSNWTGDSRSQAARLNEKAAALYFGKVAASQVFIDYSVTLWIHYYLLGKVTKVNVSHSDN